MFTRTRNNEAQTSLEYVIMIIIVVGVLLTIGNYFKRGIQGRWKASVDGLGDQYDPRYAVTNIVHRLEQNTMTTIVVVPLNALNPNDDFATHRIDETTSVDTKTGQTEIGGY